MSNRTLNRMLDDFYPYAKEYLGFDKDAKISFASDKSNANKPLGKTAYYDPSSYSVTVYTDNRHPKDIMRSVSHELVHHAQNCRGDLNMSEDTGVGYAQNDEHLREMEREAYEKGNLCFRDWEDGIKSNLQPGTIYESKARRSKKSMNNFKTLNENFKNFLKEDWQDDPMAGVSDEDAYEMNNLLRATIEDFVEMDGTSILAMRGMALSRLVSKVLQHPPIEEAGYDEVDVIEAIEDMQQESMMQENEGGSYQAGDKVKDLRNDTVGTVVEPMAGGAVIELEDGKIVKTRDKFLEKVEGEPMQEGGSMAEYGTIDAQDGNPPSKIGRGNPEYMEAYNAVLIARGEEPLDVQQPDQAYLDALHSGRLEEGDGQPKQGDDVVVTAGGLAGAAGEVMELTTSTQGEPAVVIYLRKDADKQVMGKAGDEVIALVSDVQVDRGIQGDDSVEPEDDYNWVGHKAHYQESIDKIVAAALKEYGDHETQAQGGMVSSTYSSDPEMDQVADIAATVYEGGGGLLQISNALKDQGFDASLRAGVLMIDNKYFIGKPAKFDIGPDEPVQEVGPYVVGMMDNQMEEGMGGESGEGWDDLLSQIMNASPDADAAEMAEKAYDLVEAGNIDGATDLIADIMNSSSDPDTSETAEKAYDAVEALMKQEGMGGGFDVSQIQSREDEKYGGMIHMLPDIQFTGDIAADMQSAPAELLSWLYGELESGDSIQDSAGRVYSGSDVQDVVNDMPDEMFAEGFRGSPEEKEMTSKMSNKEFYNYHTRDKHLAPDLKGDMGPIPGMEGPFQYASGAVLYYDPKAGKYYDRGSDRYLDNEEAARLTMENKQMKLKSTTLREKIKASVLSKLQEMYDDDMYDDDPYMAGLEAEFPWMKDKKPKRKSRTAMGDEEAAMAAAAADAQAAGEFALPPEEEEEDVVTMREMDDDTFMETLGDRLRSRVTKRLQELSGGQEEMDLDDDGDIDGEDLAGLRSGKKDDDVGEEDKKEESLRDRVYRIVQETLNEEEHDEEEKEDEEELKEMNCDDDEKEEVEEAKEKCKNCGGPQHEGKCPEPSGAVEEGKYKREDEEEDEKEEIEEGGMKYKKEDDEEKEEVEEGKYKREDDEEEDKEEVEENIATNPQDFFRKLRNESRTVGKKNNWNSGHKSKRSSMLNERLMKSWFNK